MTERKEGARRVSTDQKVKVKNVFEARFKTDSNKRSNTKNQH